MANVLNYTIPHDVEEPKIKDWKKKLAVNYKEATNGG